MKELCNCLGISEEKILADERHPEIAIRRNAIAYFLRTKRGYKLNAIASMLKRHHTTIMHEVKVFEGLLQVKDALAVSVWDKICDCKKDIEQ